jgi:hypothetical protein
VFARFVCGYLSLFGDMKVSFKGGSLAGEVRERGGEFCVHRYARPGEEDNMEGFVILWSADGAFLYC